MPPTTAPTRVGTPRGPVRRSRRGMHRLAWAVAGVVTIGALTAIGASLLTHRRTTSAAECSVVGSDATYTLTPTQAQNAATVSAAATRLVLPDHAVTIALATALQESKLYNLPYGDRDSLGLFQQRPSQGWGTAAQVSDPAYASTAFLRALVRLPHWQTDDVATAAQAVQRSADGTAYAQHEGEARALAIALTGQRPAGLTCSGGALSTAKATTTSTSGAVSTDLSAALGTSALTPGADTQLGRAAAAWLVANADAAGIIRVAYDGRQWTAARGTWGSDANAGATVTYLLAARAPG